MDREKAIKILGNTITKDGELYNLRHFISWGKGQDDVCLDCNFDADELEAIAWWMRNN